jgi:hypothetical protein
MPLCKSDLKAFDVLMAFDTRPRSLAPITFFGRASRAICQALPPSNSESLSRYRPWVSCRYPSLATRHALQRPQQLASHACDQMRHGDAEADKAEQNHEERAGGDEEKRSQHGQRLAGETLPCGNDQR